MKNGMHIKSIFWALIFSVSFAVGVYCLSKYSLPITLALLIIVFNSLLFGVYTFKSIRSISSLDEVQIRIQLEAVSVAFFMSLLLVMILGMVGLVKNLGLDNISYLYIFPLFFFFYFIGFFISKRKYR